MSKSHKATGVTLQITTRTPHYHLPHLLSEATTPRDLLLLTTQQCQHRYPPYPHTNTQCTTTGPNHPYHPYMRTRRQRLDTLTTIITHNLKLDLLTLMRTITTLQTTRMGPLYVHSTLHLDNLSVTLHHPICSHHRQQFALIDRPPSSQTRLQ